MKLVFSRGIFDSGEHAELTPIETITHQRFSYLGPIGFVPHEWWFFLVHEHFQAVILFLVCLLTTMIVVFFRPILSTCLDQAFLLPV